MQKIILLSFSFLFLVRDAQAEVQLENAKNIDQEIRYEKSIPELTAEGEYFKALSSYYNSNLESKLADKLAAAKSAWALSNTAKARELWQEALADRELVGEERSRASLSLAILESQEGNHEEARAIAEKEAHQMESSELRAEFWLVIAESLKEQKAYSVAEGYYKKAIAEGSTKIIHEANYLQGEVQFKLGLIDESRYSFTQVALGSEYAYPALKHLIEIDYTQKNYPGVLNWITEAKENYPQQVKDPQVSYFYISALLELGKLEQAKKVLESFKINNSETNPWFTLALSGVEAKAVNQMIKPYSPKESARMRLSSE